MFATPNPSHPAPPRWQLELFALVFFGPIALGFAVIGFTFLLARWMLTGK